MPTKTQAPEPVDVGPNSWVVNYGIITKSCGVT